MKTTKPELEVPAEAVKLMKRFAGMGPYDADAEFSESAAQDALAIATPVVIAELRRLADYYRQLGRDTGDYRSVGADLNRHADKLEAQS